MANLTYSEKLRHPKWQKRRLEIMHRDNFTCQLCGDKESALNVHHKVYRNCDIWQYEDEELVTYCEMCHLVAEFCKKQSLKTEPCLIEKEIHALYSDVINILAVVAAQDTLCICIMCYDKSTKSLDHIITMRKSTVNSVNDLINSYGE